jgi:hypothetical protein
MVNRVCEHDFQQLMYLHQRFHDTKDLDLRENILDILSKDEYLTIAFTYFVKGMKYEAKLRAEQLEEDLQYQRYR